eukprot:1178714-Prorocentrum_minimum.AAC.1
MPGSPACRGTTPPLENSEFDSPSEDLPTPKKRASWELTVKPSRDGEPPAHPGRGTPREVSPPDD